MTDAILKSYLAKTPVFAEEFNNGLPDMSKFHPSVSPYEDAISERILATGEQQVYVDQKMFGHSQLFPVGQTCAIIAQPMPSDMPTKIKAKTAAQSNIAQSLKAALLKADYMSACLSTKQAFKFGYFEIACQLGANPAGWPAFWLFCRHTHLELDFLEYINSDGLMRSTIHSNGSNGIKTEIPNKNKWHSYGGLWTSGNLKLFLDQKQVGELSYDPKYDDEGYLITNLAVGGWASRPLPDNQNAIKMQMDYIRVYQ